MDILMFTPLFHPHIGGVEKHLKRISEELIKKGHNITIITQKHDITLLDYEKIGKIEVYRFQKMKIFRIWIWIYKHRKLIKKSDIVHFHDYGTFIYWYLPFRFLYPLKKLFITFHGYEGILPIPKIVIVWRKISEYLTEGNICIGTFIPKWYGTKADFVSFGGVDELKNQINVENGSAVYIGRLESDTCITEYIEALKILKKKNINLKLDICGDGTLRHEITDYVNQNDLNVKIHGYVNNINPYMIKCSFAFLSGYLSILEAMISKKLVFSVYSDELRRDYLRSIPNSEEIMIITDSSSELANELLEYYKNPDKRKERVEKAYKFAKEQSWKNLSDIYLKLWTLKR